MFVLEYCSDLEQIEIVSSDTVYDYHFKKEYEANIFSLDRFIYLIDMHKIIESCADDLQSATIDDSDDFWKTNKKLLNFVNSVFAYKEFIKHYKPAVKKIANKYYKADKYYESNNYYRFLCDFRNYVIHQSILIKDYIPKDEDLFVDIEELLSSLEGFSYSNRNQVNRAQEFADWVKKLKEDPFIVKDSRYLIIKNLVLVVMKEIDEMQKELLLYVYQKSVEPTLKWLLDIIPKINGKYQYAFIVDKENISEPSLEPNCVIEDFIRRMICCLGQESIVCKELLSWLKQVDYTFVYDGNCILDDYIKKLQSKQ